MLLTEEQRFTLIAVCITSFLTPFTGSAINIAIPAIGKDIGANIVALTWISTSFMLASAALLLPVGSMADIKGRKPIFMAGIAIFGLTGLVGGLARTSSLLLAMRVLQGMGGALIFSTGMAILTAVTPPGMRGKFLGINSAVVYVGVSVGPVLGGFITHYLGWRYIFFFITFLTLMALLAATRIKTDVAPGKMTGFDLAGAAFYTSGLVALMYGLSIIATAAMGKWLLGLGVVLLALFVYRELNSESPLIELRVLLRNRSFAFSNLAAFINYMATSGVTFLLSIYLQMVKGLSAQAAGMVMLSQPVIMALVSPYSGRMSDKVEPQIVATWGMALTMVGLIMYQFVNPDTSLIYVAITLVVMGLGFGLFASPNNNAVMSSVPAHQYGIASSTLSTMRLVGQSFSMTVVALIIGAVMGKVKIDAAEIGPFLLSMRLILGLFAVTCVGGIFASLARGTIHAEPDRLKG
ncbi:MAG: MFS transporter [Syntrophothermus sp.]|nr:MFS transporter [Syntrophothermus sp.]